MSEQKSISKFMFYENFFLAIEKLPEEKRAKACYEFCKYGITGELPKDENIAMFCIGVSASVQKYQGRGGFRDGSGRKSKESKESKKSKESDGTNINLNINTNLNTNLNNKLKDQTENTSEIQNDNQFENQFENFWSLYTPIKSREGNYVAKGNKQKCYKKFVNLMKEGVKYETIIGNLEKYLQYCRKNGYCSCGVEVYLNQRRFENDYGQSECIDSEVRDNQRRPVSIVKIADELAKESRYDDSDSIPF